MTLRASVIVPTRDRAAVLRLVLPRLLEQRLDGGDYEVIVVDDGSTDDTPRVLEALAHRRLVALRQAQGGASAARNRALERARGRVVVFVDDDAFVDDGFLAAHLRLHDGDPRALVAGGIIEVREPPANEALRALPRVRAYHRHPMPCGNASVALEHVRRVGGFDPEMCTYGWQDQELAERLLATGLVRRFAWDAPIAHYKPAAVVLDARHELRRELDRGRMGARFYAKHPRALVGITTKMWGPIRALERVLTPALGLGREARAILDGIAPPRPFVGWRAALLRAHVEIVAGRAELARIRTSAPPGGGRAPRGRGASSESAA